MKKEIMKKNIFTILLAGVALLFAGCSDEMKQGGGSINAGDEISFGGRAGFELNEKKKKAATRTVYTGNTWTATNEAGEEKTYEGVNWVKDDKVRIFSPQAVGVNPADYTVSATNTEAINGTEQHQVSLNKIGDGALQWSDATEYDFYAVYPSPNQYPLNDDGTINTNYADNVLNGGTTIKGTIPTVQTPLKRTDDGQGNYVFAPDMKYAYMVARQKVTVGDKNSKEVYLNFVPIATAVEIELYNGITNYATDLSTLKLTGILISAKDNNTPICGNFTADLAKLYDGVNEDGSDKDGSYTGIPSDLVENGDKTYKSISIPTYDKGLYGTPTSLAPGKSIKFTVFMLPTQDVNDLTVTIQGATGSASGSTAGIKIIMHKKTYLQKMPITNDVMPFDQSEWIKYLPNNAYLSGLSIPGAGGAASGYKYSKASDEEKNYLEQSLDIAKLWNNGIRCFEFTVDKVEEGKSLGSSEVICNNQKTEKDLDYCVTEVKNLLAKYPEEFAMVIITYQQSTGWNQRNNNGSVTQTRDPNTFMSQLNTYWSNLQMPDGTEKKLYSTGLTITDVRGKLFCIARPTSNGEDNYATITTEGWKPGWVTYTRIKSTTYQNPLAAPTVSDPTILVIHGWGALKDKWYARGFTECIYHRGNGWNQFRQGLNVDQCREAMGYNPNRPGRPFDTSSNSTDKFTTLGGTDYYDKNYYPVGTAKTADIEGLTSDFYYSTVTSGGKVDNSAWVQEWARVSGKTDTYTIKSTSKYVRWLESTTEKKNHIKECLNYAINKTKGNIIYINSLCGYYITDDVEKSIYPNSLTDYNISYETPTLTSYKYVKPATLSTMSSDAGMCGDIASFAEDMNTYFYDLLKDHVNSTKPGSLGIVLMDRIGADEASTEIPSIIIANNFAYELPSSGTLDIPEDEDGFDDDDQWAKPAKRDTKSNSNSVIVWE